MDAPRTRRHSRDVRNAVCDAPSCASVGVAYKCARCASRFYCSIDCQRVDWAGHSCVEPNRLAAPTPVDELFGWMRTNVRIRKRSRDPRATTPLEQCGYLGHGSDGHVIGVIVDGQALALKLSLFDAMMREAELHNVLFRHTHAMRATGPRRSAAVVALHTHWQAHCTVSEIVMAMHPGRQVPCNDERRLLELLASERHVNVNETRLVAGMLLELMPLSLADLWTMRATDNDQFNNLYAQLVGCLAVMQPAGFTHTDLNATNARLIGCSARRVVFHVRDRYYEVPLLSSIHPGAGINGTRIVVADCGRATLASPPVSLSRRLAWDPPDSALHWPNVANPGYDMWMMAVDAVLHSPLGCQPPSIVRHMIPSPEQMAALHAYTDEPFVSTLELAVRAAATWTDIDLWDALRQAVSDELNRECYNWCAPWPPQFYRTPQHVLDAHGVPSVTHAPQATDDATLVEWTAEAVLQK